MSQDDGSKSAGGAKFTALVLEDDPVCARVLTNLITSEGGQPLVCDSIAGANAALAKSEFDVYILDDQLPDGRGSSFYYQLREGGHWSPAIMLTGYPHIPVAVELTRDGLFDYLTKPIDAEAVLARLRKATGGIDQFGRRLAKVTFVCGASAMRDVERMVRQAAANPRATMLLTGETGTGKDLLARVIHERTFANTEPLPPFISLSCPTLPAEMFEAELFGAEKGSYTGAYQQRCGLVEAAHKGTLFLDEISEVPLLLQAKLLQFLETRNYRRLGSTDSKQFDGRIVAASNRSLPEEVRQGRFRQDLLYRLDVFSIHLPPLRERMEDLGGLIEVLLEQLAHKHQRKKPVVKPKDLETLQHHDFPGNIRELRNLLERSLLQTADDASWLQIEAAWLSQAVQASRQRASAAPVAATPPSTSPVATPPPEAPPPTIEAQEYELVRKALEAEGGVIRRAAARLGISHQALLRRLEKWPELRGYTNP
jgi:DNA-binding NtrC family response regulator